MSSAFPTPFFGRAVVAAVLSIFFASGCVHSSVQTVGPFRVKHPAVRRLAVAPFASLASTQNAGQMMSEVITTELYDRVQVDVIDTSKSAGSSFLGPIERSRAQEIGRQVGADAVLYGTVLEYQYVRGAPKGRGTIPSICVNARMVSSQTGAVLWAANVVSTRLQVFTYDGIPLPELAQHVAAELVTDLELHLNQGSGEAYAPPAPPSDVKPADVEILAPQPQLPTEPAPEDTTDKKATTTEDGKPEESDQPEDPASPNPDPPSEESDDAVPEESDDAVPDESDES